MDNWGLLIFLIALPLHVVLNFIFLLIYQSTISKLSAKGKLLAATICFAVINMAILGIIYGADFNQWTEGVPYTLRYSASIILIISLSVLLPKKFDLIASNKKRLTTIVLLPLGAISLTGNPIFIGNFVLMAIVLRISSSTEKSNPSRNENLYTGTIASFFVLMLLLCILGAICNTLGYAFQQ